MKYMNILAGAFGLMTLAACSNNDEVTVEQPQGVRTITVAYNQGANTRYDITVNTDMKPPYHAYQYAQGFKVEWTVGDQIDLIKDGVTYTYEAQESGDVATFTLVSDTAPTEEGDYKVAFPAGWEGNLGGSLSFAIQDLENFDPTKYIHATGTATLSGGSFGETVNLTPVFSFIYIPESTQFLEMEYHVNKEADEYDEESSLWKGDVYLLGENLYNKIDNFEGGTGDVEGIRLENFGVYNNDDVWKASVDYIIAVPVLDQPVQYMALQFTGIETSCMIRYSDPWTDSENKYYLTIDQGGLIYKLAEDGESFLFD